MLKQIFKPTYECPEVSVEPKKQITNEICVVACGDFTGPQQRFLQMEGVERVVLGYAGGGKQEKPTTAKLYGHAEALLIEFKPHTVSYRQILEVWHECDNPWEVEKSQYRSTLFWKSLSQQNIALQFVQELQAKNPSKPLHTVVERIHKFYMAKQICPLVNLVPQVEQNHIALVACGSLLGPKKRFLEIEGVERVLIGYTGGKKDNPKNHKPYDHSEALLIEFNPDIVSYRRLLEIWYELHDPWEVEQQRRYRSAVFWKSLTQQDTALQFLEEKRINNSSKQIYTEVERVHKFYEVEQFYDHDRQMQRAELPHPSM